MLLDADITHLAYHLPLDGHLEVGNNALIAQGLGATDWTPWGAWPHGSAGGEGRPGATVGVRARFADGIHYADLIDRIHRLTGREPLHCPGGPEVLHEIGIISGQAPVYLEDALADGLDAFLTGEPSEPMAARAREMEIHSVAAGHHATETFGVTRLGHLLEERFGIEHTFIDVPNPV